MTFIQIVQFYTLIVKEINRFIIITDVAFSMSRRLSYCHLCQFYLFTSRLKLHSHSRSSRNIYEFDMQIYFKRRFFFSLLDNFEFSRQN